MAQYSRNTPTARRADFSSNTKYIEQFHSNKMLAAAPYSNREREIFTTIFSNIVLKSRNKLLADWFWRSWLYVPEFIDYSPSSVISASSSGGFTPRVDKIKKTVHDCMCLILEWNRLHVEYWFQGSMIFQSYSQVPFCPTTYQFDRFAQLVECRATVWEVRGSNPGWTSTQGL